MMKRLAFLLVCLCCLLSRAEEGFHIFTDAIGRAINARIISYDARKQTIRVQMENGREGDIELAKLSDADKKYVQQWSLLDAVRSTSKFKVSCERRRYDKSTEEAMGAIYHDNGEVEENQVIGKRFIEKIGYDISFENRNDRAIGTLIVKYCIYYVQDENKTAKQKPGVLCGQIPIESIGKFDKAEFSTDPVTIFKFEGDADFSDPWVHKGAVEGIVLRICKPGENGDEVIRTFSLPDSLEGSRDWHNRSVKVGMNK